MSEELIRRSDAINAINDVGWLEDSEYEERILAIPTIEPKRGEWIFDDPLRADFECSECLERSDICTPFCPNCGADMRGQDDETD